MDDVTRLENLEFEFGQHGRVTTLASALSDNGIKATCFPQGPIELTQDAVLVEHLALVAVLIVVVDLLAEVGRQLVEGHVLLHLLVLLLVLAPRRAQRLDEGGGVIDEHGVAGGAHDHTQYRQPDVSHAL